MQFKNILLDSESMKEWAKGMFLILLQLQEECSQTFFSHMKKIQEILIECSHPMSPDNMIKLDCFPNCKVSTVNLYALFGS